MLAPLKVNPLTDDHYQMLCAVVDACTNNKDILNRLNACGIDCGVRPQNNDMHLAFATSLKQQFFPDRA